MVTEYIQWGVGSAKIFSAVLSYENEGEARFLLEGRVEAFMEIGAGEKHRLLSLFT